LSTKSYLLCTTLLENIYQKIVAMQNGAPAHYQPEELPGLKGFSEGNMRKMRIFYEEWSKVFEKRAFATHELPEEYKAMLPNEEDLRKLLE
jgi:hypothetical protein